MKLAESYVINQPYENLFPLEEGLFRGTVFRSLYDPYKYEIPLPLKYSANDNRLLVIIMELIFYTLDLQLYLDTHPNCQQALSDFKLYNEELKKLMAYYEQKNEPLTADKTSDEYFNWVNSPWPWEREKNVDL